MFVVNIVVVALIAQVYCDERHPDVFQSGPLTSTAGGRAVEDPSSWIESAQQDLAAKLEQNLRIQKAKNVIMFLGDGWGVSTMTAARVLKGQEVDNVPFGEEGQLHVDTFPHSGMSKTFCVDSQTADSACSATAYLGGVKANIATIGLTSNAALGNCSSQQDPANHVSSILAWAQEAGKSTGIVTTTRITHASPAGNYAHIALRFWECDAELPLWCSRDLTHDIAKQLIEDKPGKDINVILGGGRQKFYPTSYVDLENGRGQRLDGLNLIERWKGYRAADPSINATFLETREELLSVDADETDFLFGLFSSDHVAYFHDQDSQNDPSLTEMTEKAIQILSKNPNGFFLFVEGGRIDHAHHDNAALRSIWEAVEFDRAIQKADNMTDDDQTLMVVTADHSHAFTFNGYAPRGSPLPSFGGDGNDHLPFSSLSYANGPGYQRFENNQRHNISEDEFDGIDYQQVPLVSVTSATHGAEDVMIFAKGPFSHLFEGVHLQSYLPHAMGYASCVGPGLTFCQ